MAPLHASVFTEGVYSRDMGRGNSREGGGEGGCCQCTHFLPCAPPTTAPLTVREGGGGRLQKTRRTP